MPNNVLKGISSKSGVPIQKLDKYWIEAVKSASKKFPVEDDRFYRYVTGIVKKRAGIMETLCNRVNEELGKDKIKKLAKSFIEGFKNRSEDGFEISEIDGSITLDSGGEEESDDSVVLSVEPLEGFKEILDEWSEEDGDSKLDDKDIKSILKQIKGMEITRPYEVQAFKPGRDEMESAGDIEKDFEFKLMDFKYDSKKDILSVTKVK